VIIEQAPPTEELPAGEPATQPVPFVLSAKSDGSLRAQARRLADLPEQNVADCGVLAGQHSGVVRAPGCRGGTAA